MKPLTKELLQYLLPLCVATPIGIAAGIGTAFFLGTHLASATAVSILTILAYTLACNLAYMLVFAIIRSVYSVQRAAETKARMIAMGYYPALPSLTERPTECWIDRGPISTTINPHDAACGALAARAAMHNSIVNGNADALDICDEMYKFILGTEIAAHISRETFLSDGVDFQKLLATAGRDFGIGMVLAEMRLVRGLGNPNLKISLWRDDDAKNTRLNAMFRTRGTAVSTRYLEYHIKYPYTPYLQTETVPLEALELWETLTELSMHQDYSTKVREPRHTTPPSLQQGGELRASPLSLQRLSALTHIKNMQGGAGLTENYYAFLNALTPAQREHSCWYEVSRAMIEQYAMHNVKEEGGTLVNCTEIADALLLAAHHLYGESPRHPSPELQGAGAVGVVTTRAEVGA
jgi:hypothetical protein